MTLLQRHFFILTTILLGGLWINAAYGKGEEPSGSRLSQEVITLLEHDYFTGKPPEQWQVLKQKFRKQMNSQKDFIAQEALLGQLAENLGWPTSSFLPRQQLYFGAWEKIDKGNKSDSSWVYPGWLSTRAGSRWFVRDIIPSSEIAAGKELKRGDEILTVNGSTYQGQTAFPRDQSTLQITVRSAAFEKPRSITVTVRENDPYKLLLQGSRSSRNLLQFDHKTIAYLRLWTCHGDDITSLVQNSAKDFEKSADAWILDLRGGMGGTMSNESQQVFASEKNTNAKPIYSKPLWILVDGQTSGSCEALAGSLQLQKRAQLVGQQTPGILGPEKRFYINDGKWMVRIPTGDVPTQLADAFPDGILPDIPARDPALYGNGVDPVQEVALKNASQATPAPTP